MPKLPDPRTAAGQASYGSVQRVIPASQMDMSGAFKGQEAMGKALQDVGQVVTKIGAEEKQRNDTLEVLEKSAALDADEAAIKQKYRHDPDPATAPTRMAAELAERRKVHSSSFSDSFLGKKFDLRAKQRQTGMVESYIPQAEALQREQFIGKFSSTLTANGKFLEDSSATPQQAARYIKERFDDIDTALAQNTLKPSEAERLKKNVLELQSIYEDKTIAIDPQKGLDNLELWEKNRTKVKAYRPPGSAPPVSVSESGKIDPVSFAEHMAAKVANSKLNGKRPSWGPQFGIKTGAPEEWARFFTMITKQESGLRKGEMNPDGSVRRFSTTLRGEKSFGPGQFNIGEYGLDTWQDVNNPESVADAYIKVAESGNLFKYFGSLQRPRETLQHSGWYDKNVAPKIGHTQVAQADTGTMTDATQAPPSPLSTEDMDTYNTLNPMFSTMTDYERAKYRQRLQKAVATKKVQNKIYDERTIKGIADRIRTEGEITDEGRSFLSELKDRNPELYQKADIAVKESVRYAQNTVARDTIGIDKPIEALDNVQLTAHLDKVLQDARSSKHNDLERSIRLSAYNDLKKAVDNLRDLREEDPASSIKRDPNVATAQEAYDKFGATVVGGELSGMPAGTGPVPSPEDPRFAEQAQGGWGDSAMKQAAYRNLLQERYDAQIRVGVPEGRVSYVTEDEARRIFPAHVRGEGDEEEFAQKIQTAYATAFEMVGDKELAGEMVEDAYRLTVGVREKNTRKAQIKSDLNLGNYTPNQMRRIAEEDRWANLVDFSRGQEVMAARKPMVSAQAYDWIRKNLSDPEAVKAFRAKYGDKAFVDLFVDQGPATQGGSGVVTTPNVPQQEGVDRWGNPIDQSSSWLPWK